MEFVVVVVPAAVLLQAGDVLRDDQVSGDGDSWSSRRLGEIGAQSDCRSRAVVIVVGASEKQWASVSLSDVQREG